MKYYIILLTSFVHAYFVNAQQMKLAEKIVRKADELVIPYEKYILANGLTVLIHEDHSDPVVHVDVTYHVGSAREEIGKSGFAHFFEHMMFQGSDHVADEQHFKIVTESGGTLNGSTNRDRTNYYQTVPSNQLEKMLWLESDRMGFLLDAVTQQKFEIQRATVKNERGQNYDNRPYGLAYEVSSKNLYPYGHPYSWLTIGYVEDLNRVDVNDLKNFFLRWYGPNNATLSIGGDVRPAEVMILVQKYFGSIPAGPDVKPVFAHPAIIKKNRYVSYTDNYAKQPRLLIVYPTVPNYHKDMGALACLAQVLGQGKNSILYQQFIIKQQALFASASSILSELAGEFTFQFQPVQRKTLAQMDSMFRNALDSFEQRGVSDEDIREFQAGMESTLINALQSVSGKVSQLAAFQTFTGNPNKIAELVQMYTSVTKEDVLRVYHQYIKGKYAVFVSVLPKGQDQVIASANNYTIDTAGYQPPDYGYKGLSYIKSADEFDRSKMPGNGPDPVVKVPAFWKKNLSNGVRMIGTENNEIPVVTLSISFPGGHLMQAKDTARTGLASIFSSMMNEDTKNYSAEQFTRELRLLGGSINVSSSTDEISISMQCLKKNLLPSLKLLEERILNPRFTQETFSRIQRQRLEGFKQTLSDPAAVASTVFARLNYGSEHILGRSESGTEQTIRNLSVQDVENYYKKILNSQGVRVVVAGDVKKAEMEKGLTFLNKLPNRKSDLPQVDGKGKTPNQTIIYLVDIPKAAQTQFRVGYVTGIPFDAIGTHYRSRLLNYPLGGDFNSRLNLNLREDKGWTYGARSSFNSDAISGRFEFSAGIKADATDSALSEVMYEITRYRNSGITEAELLFMKKSLGQRDALQYETNMQKAGFIGRMLQYNLPADYTEKQNKIVAGLTKHEVDDLAKRLLNPEKMNILLVGDKEKIYETVKKLGYPVVELDVQGNLVQVKKSF